MLSLLISAFALVAHDGGNGLPVKSPKAVGMSAERLARIDKAVERGIKAGGFPGAAVVVGRRGAAVWEKGFGRLSWSTGSPSVSAERTIYDLASLTKVVGTTTAIMILYDQGKVSLDAPVSTYIPEFSGGAKDRVTVRMLLEHRSGLPAGRDIWRLAHSPAEARAVVISSPIVCEPGRCYEYSDLGADILGFIVENVSGQRLDRFLDENVWQPLGMTDTFFLPPDSLRPRIAPTETSPPRGYPLRGEVHDENAFALGGVAGHAGLFSTAADLSIFAQMMLNGGEYNGVRIVADSTVALFSKRSAGTRALGWDTCSGSGSCGQYLGANAYGHTGFTGTSIWIDPDRDMFVVLLTNRVHDARARRPAKVIADVRADLADAAALSVTDYADGPMMMPAKFRSDRAVGWNKPVVKPRRSVATKKKKTTVVQSAKPRSTAKSTTKPKSSTAKSTTKPKSSTAKSSSSKPKTSTAKKTTTSKKPVASATTRKASTSKG